MYLIPAQSGPLGKNSMGGILCIPTAPFMACAWCLQNIFEITSCYLTIKIHKFHNYGAESNLRPGRLMPLFVCPLPLHSFYSWLPVSTAFNAFGLAINTLQPFGWFLRLLQGHKARTGGARDCALLPSTLNICRDGTLNFTP